jgi:hypothetical protein
MKAVYGILLLVLTAGVVGCGGQPQSAEPPAPLSVADWKTMPVDQKYQPETLERLKQGDPKLDTPEGWDAFSRSTLAENRKKDFPKGKRKP